MVLSCCCCYQQTEQPHDLSQDDSGPIARFNDKLQSHISKDLRLVEEGGKPHQCRVCKTEWPMPREIRWTQTAPDGLLKVKPTTLETIVVCQTFNPRTQEPMIPATVFETFTFAVEQEGQHFFNSRRLVTGIRYRRSQKDNPKSEMSNGQICRLKTNAFDKQSGMQEDYAYLRLITLNNWYGQLFKAVLSVTFLVSEFQANAMLSASFLSDETLRTALGNYRFTFIAVWLILLLVSLYYAYQEASIAWLMKSNPAKGDLINNSGFLSRMHTFIAMIVFELCLIEKDVKDIVIALHPWKGVQDFSAFNVKATEHFLLDFVPKLCIVLKTV
jgi:hypothetical protein